MYFIKDFSFVILCFMLKEKTARKVMDDERNPQGQVKLMDFLLANKELSARAFLGCHCIAFLEFVLGNDYVKSVFLIFSFFFRFLCCKGKYCRLLLISNFQ